MYIHTTTGNYNAYIDMVSSGHIPFSSFFFFFLVFEFIELYLLLFWIINVNI